MMSGDDEDTGEKTVVLNKTDPELSRKNKEELKGADSCLIIIRGTPIGHKILLSGTEMVIGRDDTADITISDQSISRKHARITRVKKGETETVSVTDLGSSNGTFVNGKQLKAKETTELHKEDVLKVGNTSLKFLPAGSIETLAYGQITDAANQDGLTKIYNKGYLLQVLEVEYKRIKALGGDLGLIFFDLDHFKKLNDTYGHDAGDYVLKEFSAMIKANHVRPKDIFARYGGEEFVILQLNTNLETSMTIAERIRDAVEKHNFVYEGKKLTVTSSIGVSTLGPTVTSATELMKRADKALYQSKTGGRNRVTAAT